MQPSRKTQRYVLIASDERRLDSFAEAVQAGLAATPKHIPCRFLYDEEGSKLFEEICSLREYYLTRAEREILEARRDEIADLFPEPILLAELGSGSSNKTRLLIEAFLHRHGGLRYVPIDISRSMLEASALEILETYDSVEIRAIAGEYQEGLRHLRSQTGRTKLIAWLGSTLGNLDRADALRFLDDVGRTLAAPDRFLLGIDLRKDREVLQRAYDDEQGVTARFSLNLLGRVNRELGGCFDLDGFQHHAAYDEEEGRIVIHLESRRHQRVAIDALDLEVEFAEGEGIHIENSYKYCFSVNLLAPRG
jgi:dimethylhistidine N-methyltransferase